jgi:hypothetical protein
VGYAVPLFVDDKSWRKQVSAWLDNQPVNIKNPPYNAKGDGVTDDFSALQACLTYCAANGREMFVPDGVFLSSQKLVINQTGNVVILADGPDSILKFTAAGSAGIDITARAYDVATGIIDRVFISDLTIAAGAVHTDPAVKIVYTAHTPNAETPVLLRNVQIRPQPLFGTNKFDKGFHGSKIYNGLIDRFTFIGATAFATAGIYLNNCISVNHENLDITYAASGVHVTTGDGGVAQEQTEGVHIENSVIYNVTKGLVVDGLSSYPQKALDIRMSGTHISATEESVSFDQTQQSAVTNCIFYINTDTKSGIIDLDGFGNTLSGNQIFQLVSAGAGSAGIDIRGAGGGHRILGNSISGFAAG